MVRRDREKDGQNRIGSWRNLPNISDIPGAIVVLIMQHIPMRRRGDDNRLRGSIGEPDDHLRTKRSEIQLRAQFKVIGLPYPLVDI